MNFCILARSDQSLRSVLAPSLTAILMAAGLSACSSTSNETQSAAAAQPQQVCTMEKPMGSQIPKRVCRTEGQIEAERSSAASTYREAIRSTAPISGDM